MRKAAVVLAACAFLAIGALAGGALALVLFDDETGPTVLRPAETAAVSEPAATVALMGTDELPALPPRVRRRSTAPEEQPRTPIAPTTDPVLAADYRATELQQAKDPTASGGAFALFQNSLVNKGNAIWIAEPDVASKGERRMVVWNFGAAFSSDGGTTFTYVDPKAEFPNTAGEFCCDQLVQYIPRHDLWVWFLQYWPPGPGNANIVRLAFAKGDNAFDRRIFSYRDFTAEDFPSLGASSAELDYPNLAVTSEHLFLAINAYAGDEYRGTVFARLPLDELAAGQRFRFEHAVSDLGSADFADGAEDVMYFAQHVDTATLRVWSWPDDQGQPSSRDVVHSDYPYRNVEPAYTCGRGGAPPGTGDWCARLRGGSVTNDDRPTDGWVAGQTIGFAWNVPRAPDRGFPYPFVMVVRIDRSSMTVRDEPFLWNTRHAYQFGTVTANDRGDLGGIVLAGGGQRYQTCAALLWDDASGDTWEARTVDTSDADPRGNESGDYLGIVTERPAVNIWVASCMVLHGGGAQPNVEVRSFEFGRAEDRNS